MCAVGVDLCVDNGVCHIADGIEGMRDLLFCPSNCQCCDHMAVWSLACQVSALPMRDNWELKTYGRRLTKPVEGHAGSYSRHRENNWSLGHSDLLFLRGEPVLNTLSHELSVSHTSRILDQNHTGQDLDKSEILFFSLVGKN